MVTTVRLRKDDHERLKDEADKLGQNLVDFVPALLRGWCELPERKRWEAIKATALDRKGN